MPTEDWFTPAYAANMAANPKDVVEVHTLEFNHPAFVEASVQVPIRAVGDLVAFTGRIEAGAPFNAGEDVVFQPIAFDYEDPDQYEGRAQEARIRVDNIGREIAQYLDAAVAINTPVQVIYRRYLSDTPTVIAAGPFYLYLNEVMEKSATIEATLTAFRAELSKVFRQVYGLETYPGLVAIS